MKWIKDIINLRKFKKGQRSSGATIVERSENTVTTVMRQDGIIFKTGDWVFFTDEKGNKMGPWEIRFFNVQDKTSLKVKHCSAAFQHTTTYVLSIGLLSHN